MKLSKLIMITGMISGLLASSQVVAANPAENAENNHPW